MGIAMKLPGLRPYYVEFTVSECEEVPVQKLPESAYHARVGVDDQNRITLRTNLVEDWKQYWPFHVEGSDRWIALIPQEHGRCLEESEPCCPA